MKPVYNEGGITRRRFLSYLVIPSAGYFSVPVSLAATPDGVSSRVDKLGFVDRDGLGPQVAAPMVEKAFFPLHEEQRIINPILEPGEKELLKTLLKSEFDAGGFPWDDEYQLSFSYQHFGVPDNSDQSELLLAYCRRVHDYVYSNLKGLFDANMAWHVLTSGSGEAMSADNQFSAHVGRYTYYMTRVFVDKPGMNDLPSLINAQPMERAIHYIVGGGEGGLPTHAHLYIIPGKTSLVSPFSEILHLTFHAPSEHYATELENTVPPDKARQYAIDAGETVNEATAIVLAREYIRKYGDDKRITTINDMAYSLKHRFADLNNAISFIEQNGPQKSLDLYLENPGRFMGQIASRYPAGASEINT
ncbi:MAG: hypothetical protein PVJ39_20265 [Gammaproteobacteria bacterium]|jgi:hypothetical protein